MDGKNAKIEAAISPVKVLEGKYLGSCERVLTNSRRPLKIVPVGTVRKPLAEKRGSATALLSRTHSRAREKRRRNNTRTVDESLASHKIRIRGIASQRGGGGERIGAKVGGGAKGLGK